ncbi:DUF726-domain-containing protein [Dothidotthia symphoricarpi CBS 119687]|uniref:DUF726-domain-containing protein n=1 Tax=Dothidotthia symphoricarpi CBS 119687 TaxID=1392245 RepID=A0A6A6AP19_9PLEO|nr:DUF726-domain-containing protein [Dothidotthia symphoricarpi CBS 119687]KAF2132933.1 DUF726-domain-containing protein [Dothidotthia symphoricarpi CBS 119687]
MTSDTPSEPPTTESKPTEEPNKAKEEVEYDDFGLPVRKRRPRTPVVDSSDDEGEFKDAVTEKERASGLETESSSAGKVQENAPDKAEVKEKGAIQSQVNGNVEKSIGTGQKEDSAGVAVEDVQDALATSQHPNIATDGDKILDEKRNASENNKQPEHVEEHNQVEKPVNTEQDAPRNSVQVEVSEHKHTASIASQKPVINEYSHQQLVAEPHPEEVDNKIDDDEWQTMPAYAHYDIYDDDNRLIAKENPDELEDMSGYANVGGAAKGYTRVIMDDDADSQTSMDDNTAYLFKEKSTALNDEDEASRDPLTQMQTTKNLLTEGQRVAYVGLVRLAMIEMERKLTRIERSKGNKKALDMQLETTRMWAQKIMVRLYGHMDINASEQIMIEQLSEHGVVPADLTPALMQNARVKNPAAEEADLPKDQDSARPSVSSPRADTSDATLESSSTSSLNDPLRSPPPPYDEHQEKDYNYPEVKRPSQLPDSKNLDIDLRWTVLCDLFLVLIADSVYDSRSRELFELVGKFLSVDWLEICRFEKRVTDALEMQEQADKENWNEDEHMQNRAKRSRNKRLAFMGLATVGGGLVIGLSAGLLAPLIGAGLAAGFTTIGVAGTSSFLAGAGGAAIITSTGVVTGSTVGVRAANRRTGAVKTFEYRPLHNNKRTHLIITLAGWMNGKVDDVRLPYSTVDPVMGDIYSVLWEPEMLRSMGATINILATEALTQGLQQVLGSTILATLMAAMTLPLALTKLSYLIDNPWVVSQARADMAGLILADSLADRNLGTRPVTLVGFSLGARVIFSCLKELAKRGAYGLVQNVYMFGTPVVANYDEYVKARAVIPGRFVNGYATNDWILGYLFRATSGGVMQVAGLAPVQIPTIENINVTELVPGHMAYRAAMPKLLREAGWVVESDEFTEIEDPDPEDHEKRQRELINEIEEARKELEKKAAEKEKKGGKLSWWRKKKGDKKEWEVYDEHSQKRDVIDRDADPATIAQSPIMFDIDAIRKEVAALAAEGDAKTQGKEPEQEFEIKEIKSTLPPMKINISTSTSNQAPHPNLRETKSFNDSLGSAGTTAGPPTNNGTHLTPNGQRKQSFDEYDEYDDPDAANMTMTFDSSFKDPSTSHNPSWDRPAPSKNAWDTQPSWHDDAPPAERPPLRSANTMPLSGSMQPGASSASASAGASGNPGYNAWADEFDDDFGTEKEVQMSFM